MLTRPKLDEFYDNHEKYFHHDAHIKTYQADKMGVKVVFCNADGRPVSETLAPMSSYMPITTYNM